MYSIIDKREIKGNKKRRKKNKEEKKGENVMLRGGKG